MPVSSVVSVSLAAATVTVCGSLQFDVVKVSVDIVLLPLSFRVRSGPLFTVIVTVTLPLGALPSHNWKVALNPSTTVSARLSTRV